ncbi:phosphatase PAP2 family protein [Paenarthrobacter nicotinovorans]|uniref:Phosphatase PAP2 family protein n=2 Tax=Paenarthrobacter nicotinovorans TaxID=29320 RepID=A0ABV0GMM4_PAENI
MALLTAAVLALGVTMQSVPSLSVADLSVDQTFSVNHSIPLTVLALILNVVFGPIAGALLVLGTSLFQLLVLRSRAKALLFALTAGWGWLACQLLKVIIGRQRPDPGALVDALVPEPVSNSFPSGHTSLAVALAIGAYFMVHGTRWAKPTAWAGGILAITVAWSRVYIGAHYPTDVFASFLATPAAILLFMWLWNRYASRLLARLPLQTCPPTKDQ